jgi:hypothetical protein
LSLAILQKGCINFFSLSNCYCLGRENNYKNNDNSNNGNDKIITIFLAITSFACRD